MKHQDGSLSNSIQHKLGTSVAVSRVNSDDFSLGNAAALLNGLGGRLEAHVSSVEIRFTLENYSSLRFASSPDSIFS